MKPNYKFPPVYVSVASGAALGCSSSHHVMHQWRVVTNSSTTGLLVANTLQQKTIWLIIVGTRQAHHLINALRITQPKIIFSAQL
jgi:hypothetical protein